MQMLSITPILTTYETVYYKYPPAFEKQILKSFPIRLHSAICDGAHLFILRICENLILPALLLENDKEKFQK